MKAVLGGVVAASLLAMPAFAFKNAGLGAQYKYNQYSYDRGILVSQLGGQVTYQGFQVFLSFLF